jgi:hypothetical protein
MGLSLLGSARGLEAAPLEPPALFVEGYAGQFGNWEHPFVAWAEFHGYTLDYCANSDLEFRPELLDRLSRLPD